MDDASGPVLVCTDGSEHALSAVRSGLALVPAEVPVVIVMVVDGPHAFAMTGSGHAGPVMSEEEFDRATQEAIASTEAAMASTATAIGRPDAPTTALEGDAGPAICHYASEVGARAIVMGSRGQSGFRRAVLGSVSDHVVRNAPCPVVVTPPTGVAEDDPAAT